MTQLRLVLVLVLLAGAALSGQAPATPQQPQPPPPPPASPPAPTTPAPPPAPQPGDRDDPFGDDVFRSGRTAFRLGGDYRLAAGDRIREIVVVFGNAVVDGTVDNNVVVVMGTARLGPMARVRDNFVVVGGTAQIAEGAAVERDMVIVGSALDAPAGFTAGGEQVIIAPRILGPWFAGVSEWLTRGLLFGRLIVPDVGWVWGAVAVFLLVYLALNVIFQRPVGAIAATLHEKPLTSFGAGLLVLLLLGPVAMLLAVSVIGIAVIPFLIAAIFAAWILGKVAVARWMGASLVPEDSPDQRAQAVRSFLIGFAIITLTYMIPLLGIMTWAVVGVLGLGAASMAFMAAYRKERPAPAVPPIPQPPAPGGVEGPPPVPPPYQPPVTTPHVSQAGAYAPGVEPGAAAPFSPGGVEGSPVVAAAMPAASASALMAMPRALFRDRFAAFVLDVIILVIASEILDELFFFNDDASPLFALIYFVGFWTWKQTTPGGVVCQLRLVRIDGNPVSFADALIRAIVGVFSLGVFFIGALWMLRDPDGQTWHDKIAGTYVVKVPRNWPF